MERNLKIRRLYAPKQYESFEVTDEFTNIPEELALNAEAMRLLTELLLLKVESGWQKHLQMRQNTHDMSPEEIIALAEADQADLYNALKGD
jgi:nucleotide-binding universal stress UspA family protein